MKKFWLGLTTLVLLLIVGGWLYSQVSINNCPTCTNGILVTVNGDQLVQGAVTSGGNGTPVKKVLSTTAVLDFASAATNTCSADLTVTLSGAGAIDACSVGVPNASVNAGSSFTCWVSAAGVVSVRHCNTSGGANDPASGTYRVAVTQF